MKWQPLDERAGRNVCVWFNLLIVLPDCSIALCLIAVCDWLSIPVPLGLQIMIDWCCEATMGKSTSQFIHQRIELWLVRSYSYVNVELLYNLLDDQVQMHYMIVCAWRTGLAKPNFSFSNTFGTRIPLVWEYLCPNTFDFEYLWVVNAQTQFV